MSTKFYQNRLAFLEDMTKTFWSVFIGSQCIFPMQLTTILYDTRKPQTSQKGNVTQQITRWYVVPECYKNDVESQWKSLKFESSPSENA